MSDQCVNCEVRGDYEKCIATPCFHRENWISLGLIKRLKVSEQNYKNALKIISHLKERVRECVEPEWTKEAPTDDGFYPVLTDDKPRMDVAHVYDGDVMTTQRDAFMCELKIELWGPRIQFPALPEGE